MGTDKVAVLLVHQQALCGPFLYVPFLKYFCLQWFRWRKIRWQYVHRWFLHTKLIGWLSGCKNWFGTSLTQVWTLLLSLLRRFSMTSMLQKGSCVPKKRILQSPLSVVLGVVELVNAWFNAEVAVISGYHKLPCFLFVI